MTKEEQQRRLRAEHELHYLGNGPAATGGERGWNMSRELYFRCVQCDYLMQADPSTYDDCFCGAMYKDADAGRFGSQFGDSQIEVYRLVPKAPVR